MTEDWAADVRKYAANPDEDAIKGIIRYCGIALQKRDSSLVSFHDDAEVGRVRDNYLRKKLGLTNSDADLNSAIYAVGDQMKADRTKNRVTVYYLLAERFGKLGLFGGAEVIAPRPVVEPEAIREPAAEPVREPVRGNLERDVAVAAAMPAATMPMPAAQSGLGWVPWALGLLALAALVWWFMARRPAPIPDVPPARVATQPAAPLAAPPVAAPAAPRPTAPVLTPATSVHFANSSAALTPEDRALVRTAAESAKASGGTLAVTGYTDNTGSLGVNQAVARNRASAVRAALIADGVPADRVVMAPPDNVMAGASPAADPQARRVDIVRR